MLRGKIMINRTLFFSGFFLTATILSSGYSQSSVPFSSQESPTDLTNPISQPVKLTPKPNDVENKVAQNSKATIKQNKAQNSIFLEAVENQDLEAVKKVSQNTNPPTFDDYPTHTIPFTGNHSPIDFDSHPDAYTYRDALNYGIQFGPNFAQHYTIVTWGCGTTCEAFAIVDAYTGAVYFPQFVSSVGLDYRLDSNLLIVDPPETIQSTYVPPGVETEYFIWKDKQLLPIE